MSKIMQQLFKEAREARRAAQSAEEQVQFDSDAHIAEQEEKNVQRGQEAKKGWRFISPDGKVFSIELDEE